MRDGDDDLFFEFLIPIKTDGLSVFVIDDLDILPSDVGIVAEGLEDGLFCGKSGRQMLAGEPIPFGVSDLFFCENMV